MTKTCVAVSGRMAKEGLTVTPFEKASRRRGKKLCREQMTEHSRWKA